MRASTPTGLSLWEWARTMGVHPLHFAQITIPNIEHVYCDQTWFQFDWQDVQRASREQIAEMISRAERLLEAEVGYPPLPRYVIDERQKLRQPYRPELVNLNWRDMRGFPLTLATEVKQVVSAGQRAVTLVEAAAPITWVAADPNGWSPTGTATAATGLTEACEIRAFYPGKGGAPEWELRPASVVLAAGTATVTIRRELAVLDALYDTLTPQPVDGTTDANFLATMDIYRVWTDPSAQASFLYEAALSCGCGLPAGVTCPQCGYATVTGCLTPRDARLGILDYQPATWDADAEAFTVACHPCDRAPDIARIWYLAGNRDLSRTCPMVEMDPQWARVVARFAAALLTRNPCSCNDDIFDGIRADLRFAGGAEQLSTYRLTQKEMGNPFGTTLGALEAWKWANQPGMNLGTKVVRKV